MFNSCAAPFVLCLLAIRSYAGYVHRILDSQHFCVLCKCAVGLVCEDFLGEDLSELYAFLVEAVQVPQEALEHDLVLEVCEECAE